MNKKATTFSIENSADALITLAALGIVIIIASFIISSFLDKDNKNAGALADEIVGKIESLEEGEKNDFPIQWLEDWGLFAYNPGEEILPDRCFFESCICVCPLVEGTKITGFGVAEAYQSEQKDLCQEKGSCRFLEGEVYIALGRVGTYQENNCIESQTGLSFVNFLNLNFGGAGISQYQYESPVRDDDFGVLGVNKVVESKGLVEIRFSKDEEGNIILSKIYDREDISRIEIANKDNIILDEEKELCIYRG